MGYAWDGSYGPPSTNLSGDAWLAGDPGEAGDAAPRLMGARPTGASVLYADGWTAESMRGSPEPQLFLGELGCPYPDAVPGTATPLQGALPWGWSGAPAFTALERMDGVLDAGVPACTGSLLAEHEALEEDEGD